jgi:alginate O-acetyltransferase complex protein AlgI
VTLVQITVLVVLAVVIGRLRKGRQLALLAVSTVVLFWLQPPEPIQTLGFWLPFGTLGLTTVSWILTSSPGTRTWRRNLPAASLIAAVAIAVECSSLVGLSMNAAVVVPGPTHVIIAIAAIAVLIAVVWRWQKGRPILIFGLSGLIILAFILIKTPSLAQEGTTWLRHLPWTGEVTSTDAPFSWLGYSYVAFRLLHTLRDRQTGRLPEVGLGEYVTYVIFFPTITAGPIDRVERFVGDLRSPLALRNDDWLEAGTRLVMGLFKKFVVADLLAVISFGDVLVDHVRSPGWMWLFLYAYAFRIYFDFSGYTDMAIGMGRLLGVRLPENFQAPYLKQNIALFWNSWHMSLTQWFRSYVFNPLTRRLRSRSPSVQTWVAVLITQLITMLLIGLWHGITWSFAIWGLWHGLGLFVHNRWLEFARRRWPNPAQAPAAGRAAVILGTFITFNFVAVGWLFFGLSSPALAWKALCMLVGVA